MLVFRDGRQAVTSRGLVEGITTSLRRLSSSTSARVDGLVRSGELECALADAGDPAAASIAQLTDEIAWAVVDAQKNKTGSSVAPQLCGIQDRMLTLSRPEGFAYYALHPLDYADLAGSRASRQPAVAVIGIRSIGTALSAVVKAELLRRGVMAERITVRPTGHPWDRQLELALAEREWIVSNLARQAEFWVVDEGPGLSGSSFLSVGEALLTAGVSADRIIFLGSAPPNVAKLRARDAAQRWSQFRSSFVCPQRHVPAEAAVAVGGGAWRSVFLGKEELWPASWTSFERAKFLSADRRWLFKFEGFGRFGAEVRQRAQRTAEAGFSPAVYEAEDGFLRYPVLAGCPLSAALASTAALERIAEYLAWRSREFAAEPGPATALEHMVCTNLSEGLGEEYVGKPPELSIERPVVCDGRMHPHEWLLLSDGRMLKFDGVSHGDDHFFPGPTDIAWDMAGVIVEWRLELAAVEFLLERYRRESGDDVRSRLRGFLLAYTMFRSGYCAMAGESQAGERERFQRELKSLRTIALAQLAPGATLPLTNRSRQCSPQHNAALPL